MAVNVITLVSGTVLVALGTRLLITDEATLWPLIVVGVILIFIGQTLARYDDIPNHQQFIGRLAAPLKRIGLLRKAEADPQNQNNSNPAKVPTAPSAR